MNNYTAKTLITALILIILVVAALKFAIRFLFPVAIIVVAAYIVYTFFVKKR